MNKKAKLLKGYLSARQVAEKLGMKKQGVRYLINNGLLPSYYIDNFYVISEKDFDKFVKEREKIVDGRYKNSPLKKS